MAVLVVALLNAAVLWRLWPQPDGRFLLGAWTLAVGDCALAPYLATGLQSLALAAPAGRPTGQPL